MNFISKEDKIVVFGSNGMAGNAICRALNKKGYSNIFKPIRKELSFFKSLSYDFVVFSERFFTCETNTKYSFMSLRISEVLLINYFANFFSNTSLIY